jgi:mercuric ion transport protein
MATFRQSRACITELVEPCCAVDSARDTSAGERPLTNAAHELGTSNWKRLSTFAGAIAVALLPKCPACWSAYAGLSSLLGLSFVVETRYLLPLTSALLGLCVCALALQARAGRGHGPWLLGLLASAGVLTGKFMLDSQLCMYTAVAGLALAASWSGWLGVRQRRQLLSGVHVRTAR